MSGEIGKGGRELGFIEHILSALVTPGLRPDLSMSLHGVSALKPTRQTRATWGCLSGRPCMGNKANE